MTLDNLVLSHKYCETGRPISSDAMRYDPWMGVARLAACYNSFNGLQLFIGVSMIG